MIYVRELKKNEFRIDITDCDGRPEESLVVNGKSLYSAYHDYMKFPPENKRKPATDNLFFYDLDHSYKDYKGLKYCVKE